MKLNPLMASLVSAGLLCAPYTLATPPKSWPDGRGGLTTEFKGEHFDIIEHAYVSNNVVIIPRTGSIQAGCAFYSPKVPVFHGDGYANIRISLQARWSGFIDVNKESDAELFRVSVATSSNPYAKRAYMHTGLMYKEVDYIGNNGINHYIANTSGWKNFNINHIKVSEGDEIWFKVCDIEGGSNISVRSARIHTYPVGN
jgi:hypothetical protein